MGHCKNILLPFLAAALLAGGAAGQAPQADSDNAAPAPGPAQLVDSNEEMATYLSRARQSIAKNDYPGAIEILQALLNRPQQCLVPTRDGRLCVSLSAAASAVIGELPEEGLKLYRRLHDAEADELLRRARAGPDDRGLHDVIRRYFHTGVGDQAMNLLGARLFDRGRFSQAGRCWRDILARYRQTDLDVAVVLVKIAVAHHFAGQERQAAEALDTLRAEHADARRRLGGQVQPAVGYVQRILSAPPPGRAGGASASDSDWPCLAGSADGVAVMGPCRQLTLTPRWTRPDVALKDNPNLVSLAAWLRRQQPPKMASAGVRAKPRKGHLVWPVGGSQYTLPAVVHPIVVGDAVIFRDAKAVYACDLHTGAELWQTLNDFPLYRSVGARAIRFGGLGAAPITNFAEDKGRYTLSAGGGMLFALGRFRVFTLQMYTGGRREPPQEPDSSALVAFSLAGEGKLIWSTDEPGRPEILRQTRFISAPTYAADRLYVMGVHGLSYWLFCLDAGTGRMLWPEPVRVSLVPVAMDVTSKFVPVYLYDRGSAPAVADGRVLVCTNAGVLGAFDADTGMRLWTYQYDSSLNQPARPSSTGRITTRWRVVPYPPNPVIATGGRAIFLPADGDELLALRADTGLPAWKRTVSRSGQRDLTAVDEGRVLLSGPGMTIVDVGDGKELWSWGGSGRKVSVIHGRPAVTAEAILASGQGEVVVVTLADYSVKALALADGQQSLLGNLVCAGGKLVAASAAGICAYFGP